MFVVYSVFWTFSFLLPVCLCVWLSVCLSPGLRCPRSVPAAEERWRDVHRVAQRRQRSQQPPGRTLRSVSEGVVWRLPLRLRLLTWDPTSSGSSPACSLPASEASEWFSCSVGPEASLLLSNVFRWICSGSCWTAVMSQHPTGVPLPVYKPGSVGNVDMNKALCLNCLSASLFYCALILSLIILSRTLNWTKTLLFWRISGDSWRWTADSSLLSVFDTCRVQKHSPHVETDPSE